MALRRSIVMWVKSLEVLHSPKSQLKQNLSYCIRLSHANALRPMKGKSNKKESKYFLDSVNVRVVGGKGGDGCISFLQLWCNERAGPDGGDGGNGGHVIFQSSSEVRNFNHVQSLIKAPEGNPGSSKDCHGRNAQNTIVKVPVGTVIRLSSGKIVCDLDREGLMYVAARGGIGGKGNRFFATAEQNSPKVCEYGPTGEDMTYKLELKIMAHIGLIGCPNAGKSTLLTAISRAKPKVAPYAFTTLRPHIGIVTYRDFEQLAVADLPGLIEGSHMNKGLGIEFLKHIDRCSLLLYVLDVSCTSPWEHYYMLVNELKEFNSSILSRPSIIVANKIDVDVEKNLLKLQSRLQLPVIPVSAKKGTNISLLLTKIREFYEESKIKYP